jgi:hypothetical protein
MEILESVEERICSDCESSFPFSQPEAMKESLPTIRASGRWAHYPPQKGG